MARKQENYYFKSFVHLIDYSCKAASYLHDLFLNFDGSKMEEKKNEIHLIEHEADLEKHKVTEKLVREFLPPISHEDVLNIIRVIDDVTDSIEDIALRLYMYNVQELKDDAHLFTEIICECCEAVKAMLEEFENFKRSKKLKDLINNVLQLEEKCDAIYTKAVRDLFVNEKDERNILIWSDLYYRLENCCDTCGEVSSIVETAYMKNL